MSKKSSHEPKTQKVKVIFVKQAYPVYHLPAPNAGKRLATKMVI